jgi:5-methylcytosine-specific restriction endonuclease McrA
MNKRLEDLARRAASIERDSWQLFWGTVAECSSILKEINPVHRRPFLAVVVQDLHKAQNGLCALCRKPVSAGEWEIDHKVPFCYGGDNQSANLQIAHVSCNRSKGRQVDVWDLLRYLEGRYQSLRRPYP